MRAGKHVFMGTRSLGLMALPVGFVVALVGCAPGVAISVDFDQWAGPWDNVDPNSRSTVYYNVSRELGALRFDPYASFSPQECVNDAVLIRDGEWKLDEAGVPVAEKFVDQGYATKDHAFGLVGSSVLDVETRTVFRDDRAEQSIVERYRPDASASARAGLSGEFIGTTPLSLDDGRALGPMSASFAQEGVTVTGILVAAEGVVAECWGSPASFRARRSGHVVMGTVNGAKGRSSVVIHLLDGVHLMYEGDDYVGPCRAIGASFPLGRLRP